MATLEEIAEKLAVVQALQKATKEDTQIIRQAIGELNGRVRHTETELAAAQTTISAHNKRLDRHASRIYAQEQRDRNIAIGNTIVSGIFAAIAGFIGWGR